MKRIIGFIMVVFLCIALHSGCANPDIEKIPPEEMLQKAVMVNDVLYYYTGQHIELLRCGVMDGKISEMVPVTELPAENGQSNFGTGYEYQFVDDTHIDLIMPEEDAWVRFCGGNCTDDHSQTLTKELYSQQSGDFVPDYDTELYDGIPDTVNPGGPCIVFHTDDCPEGACTVVEEGVGCIRTGSGKCICGYGHPPKDNTVTVVGNIQDIKTFPGHIRIVE